MTARPPIMFSGMEWNKPATMTMAVRMTGTIKGMPPSRLAWRMRCIRVGASDGALILMTFPRVFGRREATHVRLRRGAVLRRRTGRCVVLWRLRAEGVRRERGPGAGRLRLCAGRRREDGVLGAQECRGIGLKLSAHLLAQDRKSV